MVENLTFNLSNFHKQDFLFPLKLINYVNQEADAEVKQKLDRTCKHFFKELPYLIIDTLEINQAKQRMENEAYDGCLDFINAAELRTFANGVCEIWVTKKMYTFILNASQLLTFNKIYRCDASEVSCFNLSFPFRKMKILSGSGKIQCLTMRNVTIIDSFGSNQRVPLEDILNLVPNARKIELDYCHIFRRTITNMLQLPFKNKITEFSLKNVDGPLCPHIFFKFVKKYVDPEAKFHVSFNFENNEFEELYNQKVAKSREKMPTIGTTAPPWVKKKTKIQHVLSWMASCASFIQIIKGESVPFKVPSAPKQLTKVTYNDENIERQYLAFPYPHMCYIRENADGELWKKLEQTCRFFHQKNKYFILDDFHLAADRKITLMVDDKKITLDDVAELKKINKPIWLLNSLDLSGYFQVSKEFFTEVKKILIGRFDTRMVHFKAYYGFIKDSNSIDDDYKISGDDTMSFKEFLIHLPNAEEVSVSVRGINPQNTEEPIILPYRNNIKFLSLQFIYVPIFDDTFFDVLTKSLAPRARVNFYFAGLENTTDVPQFEIDLKAKLDTWKPQIEKPSIKIFFEEVTI